MKKSGALSVFACFFLLGFSVSSSFAFETVTCEVSGRIVEVLAEDLDGDGKKDMTVSYKQGIGPNAKGRVAVFFAGEQGAYTASPQVDIALPGDACLFDVGDLDRDGHKELILYRKWQIQSAPIGREGTPAFSTLLKKGSGVLFPNAEHEAPYENLVRPWFGGDADALALPDYGRFHLYQSKGDAGLVEAGAIELPIRGWISSSGVENAGQRGFMLQSGVTTPSVFLEPEGSAPRPLVVTAREEAWFFAGTVDGFAAKPSYRHFSVLTDQEHREANMDVRTRVEDLDGDGHPEIILNKFGGSFKNFHSEVRIYKGTKTGFETAQNYSIAVNGYTPMLQFWDIDGDRKKEMVLPTVEVGLTQMARMLISQSVKVDFNVYRCKNGGALYGEKPDLSHKITYKVDTEPVFRFVGFTPDFGGDFDGDGDPDLIMNYQKGFGVWRNSGGLAFEEAPFLAHSIEPSETYRLTDLNGDRKSDLYLWDAVNPKTQGRLQVLLNR